MKAVLSLVQRHVEYRILVCVCLALFFFTGGFCFGEKTPLFDPGGMSVEMVNNVPLCDRTVFRMACMPHALLDNVFYVSQISYVHVFDLFHYLLY